MLSCVEHSTTHISAAEVTVTLCTVEAVVLLAVHGMDNSMLMVQEALARLCLFLYLACTRPCLS